MGEQLDCGEVYLHLCDREVAKPRASFYICCQMHWKLSDRAFEKSFADSSLDPELFDHEAHIRLAWIHIHQHGLDQAIENIKRQLKQYVKVLGAEDKYNETLTVAAARAVYHFMLKSKSTTFKNFIAEFPRLKYNFKELIDAHYGVDIYRSAEAKKKYLEPGLLPFD